MKLLEVIGQPELAEDPRFGSNEQRVAHADALRDIITSWTSTRTKRELAEKLGGQVPAGPVNDITDVVADPHIAARGMLPRIEIPGLGRQVAITGVPVHLSATPGGVRTAGPGLGQHNTEVFEQFGITRVSDLGERMD